MRWSHDPTPGPHGDLAVNLGEAGKDACANNTSCKLLQHCRQEVKIPTQRHWTSGRDDIIFHQERFANIVQVFLTTNGNDLTFGLQVQKLT